MTAEISSKSIGSLLFQPNLRMTDALPPSLAKVGSTGWADLSCAVISPTLLTIWFLIVNAALSFASKDAVAPLPDGVTWGHLLGPPEVGANVAIGTPTV